jgi:hypothetical protein
MEGTKGIFMDHLTYCTEEPTRKIISLRPYERQGSSSMTNFKKWSLVGFMIQERHYQDWSISISEGIYRL